MIDLRTPTPWGRIPYPEDIFGTVRLDHGVIVPHTYERMPTHRLVTSNGLFVLSEGIHQYLIKRLLSLK